MNVTKKTRQKSTLRRPGANPAPLRPKPAPAVLQHLCKALQGCRLESEMTNQGAAEKNVKTVEKTASGRVNPCRVQPAAGSEAGTDFKNIYWTFHLPPISQATRDKYKLGPGRKMPIHDGLGSVEFATAAAVMEYLETLGWNPTSIRNKPVKFARVGETDRGFYVEIFQSYAAAMAAEKSRAATVPTQERRAA